MGHMPCLSFIESPPPCLGTGGLNRCRQTRQSKFRTPRRDAHRGLEGRRWRRVGEQTAGELDGRVVAGRQVPRRAGARVELLRPVLVEAVAAAAGDVDQQTVMQRKRGGCRQLKRRLHQVDYGNDTKAINGMPPADPGHVRRATCCAHSCLTKLAQATASKFSASTQRLINPRC